MARIYLHSVDSSLIDVTCSSAFGASGGSGLAPGFIAGAFITSPTTSTRWFWCFEKSIVEVAPVSQ
ncbi:hypothetical protein D3C83_196490 [compost metagenome]